MVLGPDFCGAPAAFSWGVVRQVWFLTGSWSQPQYQRVQIPHYSGLRAQRPYLLWIWGPHAAIILITRSIKVTTIRPISQ